MKFAHLADCHIGAWRDPRLKELPMQAFEKAIDKCISEKVDFVLISGDLFNTSLPGIEYLKRTVKKLKILKNKDIPVYIIAGSHDFSPSGKTIIDVLEEAGLVTNVVKAESIKDNVLKLKFTIDEKTGAKIAGMLGKKGMLERSFYESLDKTNLEKEKGFKIFMFHSAISELKPKELEQMDSNPISFLPKGFDYYAGGHVHIVKNTSLEGYKNVVYPGPLFPNNFLELEKLEKGGFYIYDDGIISYEPIQIKNIFLISINVEHKTPEKVMQEFHEKVNNEEFYDTIVLVRIEGTLEHGKPSDISFKEIYDTLNQKGNYYVMRNTNKLKSKEFEEIKTDTGTSEEIEEKVIKEHLGQIQVEGMKNESEMTKKLMDIFAMEKQEGEKVYEFEDRLKKEVSKVLDIDI